MKKHIDIIKTAKKLIKEQLASLNTLIDRINEDFQIIVELIANNSGRLIVIGLGKSGIIGRKIVATLNSTGTLASFIHASDALHGDMGNINNNDIVLFISKSGNTEELIKLLPLIKKMNVKIIAMTGNKESYLAINSDFILDVSIIKEACPNNLAPTTSTTAQLVMGDAIAVSLLQLNNFTEEDFAKVHPGGSLGKKLNLSVNDLCDFHTQPLVLATDTLEKVIIAISSNRQGATAVSLDKKIIGIITDGDLRRMLETRQDISNVLASDLMTLNPKTINKNELAYKAFSIMKKYSITQLLVFSEDEYCGIIHLHDIVKHNIF
jgi:arabinose-5-phosphate isomerase